MALVLVVPVSVVAARWQWHRHLERDAMNAAIIQSERTPPVPWQTLELSAARSAEWRRVTAHGEWLLDQQQLVRKSVVNGEVGFDVYTPFRDADGSILCVLRGWIPTADSTVPPPATSENATIVLRVRRATGTGPIRPSDLPSGQINRIDPKAQGSAVPAVFELISPVPDGLVALPWPELTSGPHLSYFVQWILIGCTAVVVYFRVMVLEFRRPEDDEIAESSAD